MVKHTEIIYYLSHLARVRNTENLHWYFIYLIYSCSLEVLKNSGFSNWSDKYKKL